MLLAWFERLPVIVLDAMNTVATFTEQNPVPVLTAGLVGVALIAAGLTVIHSHRKEG